MLKRISSAILLALLLGGYALPLHGGGMVCAMDRTEPVAVCGSCESPSDASVPTLSASSCCRFEGPKDVAPAPVLLGGAQNGNPWSEGYALASVEPYAGVTQGVGPASPRLDPRDRSSTAGTSLTTALRL